jgi:hypothetical protein
MYHLDTKPKIPKVDYLEPRKWHQAPNPSLVESFSWSVLKELFKHALQPTPFRVFNRPAVQANLKCYPWLIVEYKKEDVTRAEEVCCQAANAAACAVRLNHIAAKYAIKLADDAQIPPIATVTTIGSYVKVWIAYFSRDLPTSSYEQLGASVMGKECKQGHVSQPHQGRYDHQD